MPHCIVTSHPEYIKLLEESGLKEPILKAKISVWQEKTGDLDRFPTVAELNSSISSLSIPIKAGVSELFQSNPELANIGTPQQYSQYLDTIFPDSKMKDIVYHGSPNKIEQFDKSKLGINTGSESAKNAFFFASNPFTSFVYTWKTWDLGQDEYSGEMEYAAMYQIGKLAERFNEKTSLKELLNDEEIKSISANNTTFLLLEALNKFDEKQSIFFPISETQTIKFDKDYTNKTKGKFYLETKGIGEENFLGIKTKEEEITKEEFDKLLIKAKAYLEKQKADIKIYQILLNSKNPLIVDDKNEGFRQETYSERVKKAKKENNDSVIINNTADPVPNSDIFAVFEPEQIHILGSKADIQGFKEFVQDKQFQKLTAEEKAKTIERVTKEHRSIAALKDLAHKLAHRVGGKVEFANKTDVDWKGYNQGMTSVLNEAYMTPDTPFHEILAHPIIRAIKNKSSFDYDQANKHLGTYEGFNIYAQEFRVKNGKYYYKSDKTSILKPVTKEWYDGQYRVFEQINTNKESKNFQSLYQSLLKELETSRGKEVLEQVKRDYTFKKDVPYMSTIDKDVTLYYDKNTKTGYIHDNNNPSERKTFNSEQEVRDYLNLNDKYTLEEQQEEAIVTLLGMMAADKLDKIKDATLISKLKELWKQISDFVRQLLLQDEIRIDELPITTTLNDLAEIMAYGNNKIILPGYKVEYSTPLGNKYDTLEEVNQEIRNLADANIEVDLSGIKLKDKNKVNSVDEIKVDNFAGVFEDFIKVDGKWYNQFIFDSKHDYSKDTPVSDREIIAQWNARFDEVNEYKIEKGGLEGFIEKNKEYAQSKEIIEQWKKENNIQYDPEEVYSRGQEFYHIHNAYSRNHVDTKLWIQNLLETIQDKAKIGAKIEMSFATAPKGEVGKGLQHHNKKTKQTVYITSYPKSEDIEFVSQIDNYTSSFTDLTVDMIQSFTNKKNERVGIALTKSVPLSNLNTIQPNLATAIDNVAHHNEIVIGLTPFNFRINYEEDVPYHLKKLIDNINKILDDKYGKLVKPEISAKEVGQKYEVYDSYENKVIKSFSTEKEAINYMQNELPYEEYRYSVGSKKKIIGKQPTQTRENTTSIESVHSKVYLENRTIERKINNINEVPKIFKSTDKSNKEVIIEKQEDGRWVGGILGEYKYYFSEDKVLDAYNKSLGNIKEKEYTSQAETNLKIAALKEVARKYPRSLVTSKVVPINPNMVDNSEIQYSKISDSQPILLSYNPQDLFLNNLKKQLRISGTKSRIQIANINEKIAEINKSYNVVVKLDVSKIGQSDSFKLDLKLLKNSYHKYLSEKTLKDVLEKVSSTNTVMSTLAKKLLNKIDGVENVPVEYISNEEFRKIKGSVVYGKSAAALYIPNENKIVVNIDYINKHPESIIIHEILHAITYHYIRTNDTIAREWQKLYNKVKKEFEGDPLYESHALRDADELLTAVFTNANFINALAARPSLLAQRATLWDDIKNFFKNILGLNNIERTLYDDVFEKASEVIDVAAQFNKSGSDWSLFDDMPLAEIQEDELESYIDPRINRAIDKMVNTLSSKKKELNEQYIKGQHADISRRKNLIENSIVRLISKESPIDDLITVGYRDLSLAQKYFNKTDISNWEAAQLMYTIEAIKVLDEDLKGVEMTDEQSAKLSKLRQKALEFSSKFDAFLKTRLEVLSRAKGLEISNIDFASPYTDRNIVSAATYNMGISEIPHLRVGEAIIQNLMRSAQEQIDSFRKERELLIKEVGREAFAKIFDSSGYLITEYKREFFDEEKQQIQEANDIIYSETASPEEKRRAESKLLKWFLDNYDYYLTEEGKADYETELNNVTEDSENDAAAIKEFELRYSWLNQGNIDANGKFIPNKLFVQYKDGVKASGWYKYLKAVPKSIHRDSRYDSIKDTPAYDFYVKKMIEASLKIPHELAVERGSFYKFLKHVKLDAAESVGGLSVFAKTLWKEMKNWTNVDISIAQAEGRDIRLVDEKGRPKGKIPYKAVDEIKVKDPLKLLEDFYKTAVMYEARLDAQSQLDLVGYDLEKLPGYSRNKIGAIRKDMAGNQVLIEGGLTNAINQFRYRKEAALTGKTRTDENIGVVKPTPEEIEAKKATIKAKREAGIEITPEDYMFNRFSVVKSLDSAIDYTRLLLIGLKPFTAIANLLIGLGNNYIYGARNTDFSESNLNWGLKKIFKAYTIGLVTKNKEAFKLANLAEKFGLTETLFEDQGEYQSEFFSKVTKFMMSLQAGGEFVISVQNMLAFMDKIKIKDKSGKERRLYDAYDEFGHWRKDVFGDMPEWENMTVLDGAGTNISKINQLRNRIDEIRDRTQGDYRNPMPAKGKVWGRILALFRTWLPRGVHERLGSHNPATGFKGRYRSYGTAFAQSWNKGGLKEALKLLGATSLTTFVKTMNLPVINTMSANVLSKLADTTQRSYDNYLEKLDITELDVQNMRSNIKELQFILFTLMLIAALKGLDDDDEQNPMLNFTLNLSNRLYQDLTFFTIPTSFMSIVKDPIPLYASVKGTVDVINALTNYIEDPSKDEYKTGYRKGDSKTWKEITDMLPIWSSWNSTQSVMSQVFSQDAYRYTDKN